jgi:chromate reductase
MEKIKIGIIAGSLRKASFCRKLANNVLAMLPSGFEANIIEIGNLPMYNQDYDDEGKTPPEWDTFRNQIKSCDGFLLITPEYNRSIPPVLKNAVDIASRPYGKNVWDGKGGGIISLSVGKLGAFGANHALRQVMVFLNVLLLQQPEAYIGEAASLFDAEGKIAVPGTKKFLEDYCAALAAWITRLRKT